MEEIRFVATREDYWHFTLYALLHRPRVLIGLALFLFGVFLLIYVSMDWYVGWRLGLPFTLFMIVLAIGLIGFRLWLNASKASQAASKRGTNIISIDPVSVHQRNEYTDSTTSWKMIKAIRQDRYNFYFLVDNPGSNVFMAFLLPRHAFASSEKAESFIERARGYWQEQREQAAAAVQ